MKADGITQNNTATQTSELYDPSSNSWSFAGPTGGSALNSILLNTGEVLAFDESGPSSSDLINSTTGRWTPTLGNMKYTRVADTVTLLDDGRALVAGGCGPTCTLVAQSEIYDPAFQTWTLDASLFTPRWIHSAVRLRDGRVLVAGGANLAFHQFASAEVYKPARP